eukprot:Hpha_TRINITY_DN12032_c0_g1::TRINITY_DN12032_c0_g1_i1::g.140839::m.140839
MRGSSRSGSRSEKSPKRNSSRKPSGAAAGAASSRSGAARLSVQSDSAERPASPGASPGYVEEKAAEHERFCREAVKIATTAMKRTVSSEAELAELVQDTHKELRKAVQGLGKLLSTLAPPKGREAAVASRFSVGVSEIDVDKGQCEFFTGASMAKDVTSTVDAALQKGVDEWRVCKACGNGIEKKNLRVHFSTRCKKRTPEKFPNAEGMFEPMTAEWAVQQAREKVGEDAGGALYLAMYSLNSPLCYTVGAAMRNVAFKGARTDFEPMKDFAYALHRAMCVLPKYEGTVFRAMDFKVDESLYARGAVVTLPHATSASWCPSVVKDFLGKEGRSGGVKGTILILKVARGRNIERFSQYPEEREVLISTNTQFRVVGRPEVGMRTLLEGALEIDLSGVAIVELQEISFVHWGQFPSLLSTVERMYNQPLLEAITQLESARTGRECVNVDPVTNELIVSGYPLASDMPKGKDGVTLLRIAAEVPRNEQVVSLCMANLSPEKHSEALNDAFVHALQKNQGTSHWGSIAVLLSKGALPRGYALPADIALIACSCKERVVCEVEQVLGGSFWMPGAGGRTVLHAAAEANRADLLQRFLEADDVKKGKPSVDCTDKFDKTPCMIAAEKGACKALRTLIAQGKADVNKGMTEDGKTACMMAALAGHADALQILIVDGKADANKATTDDGTTPCLMAAGMGHADALRVLIEDGKADVNKAETVNGVTPCLMAALKGHADSLRVLIADGKADVNKAKAGDGVTPCFVAAQVGHADALRVLIADGKADVDKAETATGVTPCFIAAQVGHSDALRILIADGKADVNKAKTDDGRTPCFMAAQKGHADVLRILIADGNADVNKATTNTGATPCFIAAQEGRADALRVLIEDGKADVNKATTAGGCTPCQMAAQEGHADALRVLIEVGKADVKIAREDGATPLKIAEQGGHAEVVQLLKSALE